MAFTLTTDTITGASGVTETVIVVQDTNSNSNNEQPTAIAVDYSSYLSRIATALENIVEQITPTVLLQGEITPPVLADQFTRIREQITPVTDEAQAETLADQIARLRYLGDPDATEADSDGNHGTGVRISNPFSTITNALTFESIINNGNILRNFDNEITDSNLQSFLDGLNNRDNNQVRTRSEERLSALVSEFRGNSIFNNYK